MVDKHKQIRVWRLGNIWVFEPECRLRRRRRCRELDSKKVAKRVGKSGECCRREMQLLLLLLLQLLPNKKEDNRMLLMITMAQVVVVVVTVASLSLLSSLW